MFVSIKNKYIILYFFMTIIPIIIIIILIYQLGSSRLYANQVKYNLNYLQLVNNSLKANNIENLESQKGQKILDTILKDFDIKGQAFYIIDNKGKKIFSKEGVKSENYSEKIIKYNFKQNNNQGFINEKAFITFYNDESKKYKFIILSIPNLMNNKIYFIKELLVIIAIVSIISMISIVLISYYLTRPIRKLSRDIERNSVSFEEEVIVKDEIWDISIHLKKIYQELKEQSERRYVLEMKTNKAQFKALQSQINPHFLYNTLGTINSIALIEKVPLIADLSKSLANMFRYNISNESEYVTLKEELEHINNYLNVQMIRFEGIIDKAIDVDESLLSCKVVKFVLQPIIENCFIHAFSDLDEKGILRVKAYRKESTLNIDVEDNGVIVNQDKLNQMNQLLKEIEVGFNQRNKGIGLSNVNSRIKLAFGNDYGLSFYRLNIKGLRVKIKIPFETIDEEEENVSVNDY